MNKLILIAARCICKMLCVLMFMAFFSPIYAQVKPQRTQNDLMYPAAETAKPFIDYDGKGFIINGKHTFLTSGTIHYPRVPSALWADRLLRMKRAGFDAVETYTFWNYHEQQENVFDFTGEKDFEGFLNTAQKIGLDATVRVGPYVCAEWDLGGYPIWLKFKPPFNVRTADSAYLKLNDHWYDKILPMVAKHQINRGGNVILVQLENEHPLGWGVVNDDPYFVHLRQQAIKDGIEVPYFFSGLHHGGPPAIGNINTETRTNPWYTTEFWAGWFDAYRDPTERRVRNIDQTTWSIQAHAGGGYNFYMVHGGTNFETWNDASTAASYDYGTAIGQAGDFRLMYYRMKRANQLAQSFPGVIGNAQNAADDYKDFISGKDVEVLGAPRSADGTLVYIRNKSNATTTAQFKTGETLLMPRYSTYPIPVNLNIAKGVQITSSTLPVLATAHNDGVVTLIVYGQPAQHGHINIAANNDVKLNKASNAFTTKVKGHSVDIDLVIPANGVEELDADRAGEAIRILAINQDLSLYTWLIGDPGKQYVVLGSSYVSHLSITNNKPEAVIERPYGQPSPGRIAVYGAKNQSWNLGVKANGHLDDLSAPVLSKWQMAISPEALPGFDDRKWMHSESPLTMGADGDISAFAWYHTTVNTPAGGNGVLKLKYNDNIEVYVNGVHATQDKEGVKAVFAPGKNTIAILASHAGRNKQFNYTGPLNNIDNKGILSDVTLELNNQTTTVKNWAMRGGATAATPDNQAWVAAADSKQTPGFYKATFTAAPPQALGAYPIFRISVKELSRGTVWINGHNLGRYPEKIRVDGLYIPECWLKTGQNSLVIFDETGVNPANVKLMVEKQASREVVRATEPVDAKTPIVVPLEFPEKDIPLQNIGNLAYLKPVTATEGAKRADPQAITDGDLETQWAAAANVQSGSSFQIDLGKSETIKTAEIYWAQEAKKYTFTLSGSDDGQAWTKIGDQSTAVPTSPDSPSELSRFNLPGQQYRYLQVTIQSGKPVVAEFKVFDK